MTLSFATKQTYLDWRTEKRAEYRALARTLRELRVSLSKRQSDSMKRIWREQARAKAEGRPPRWKKLVVDVAPTYHSKQFLRAQATALMQLRREAKAVAIASWETWRQSNQP